MSLSATLFGSDSAIFKVTNILGLGIPGWLNKQFGAKEQKPTTQRIGELAQQTAKEGEPRPIIWGRVRPISGNVMHSSTPRIITREVQGQSSGGGKGGKKKQPKQFEERVFRTYAIRICEGPITAIVRVWRNNKLVYDARGNAWGTKNNGVFLKRARFYLGGWAQMPDPTLESVWGAGNVPAYRGTCYMVVPDEDLTDQGGAVPQYIFEVERAEGVYFTSKPYPIECTESAQLSEMSAKPGPSTLKVEAVTFDSLALESGSLRSVVQEYGDYGPEALDLSSIALDSGNLISLIKTYEYRDPEAVDLSQIGIESGIFKNILVTYDEAKPEAAQLSIITVESGALT
jgi:hypothetical protein